MRSEADRDDFAGPSGPGEGPRQSLTEAKKDIVFFPQIGNNSFSNPDGKGLVIRTALRR